MFFYKIVRLDLIVQSFYGILSPNLLIQRSIDNMNANVRRYVALAQSRGGACFCTRGAMQGYDVDLFVLALAKTVTPEGSAPRERGQAAPPTT